MDSCLKRFKSLKDTLLEYAVLNVDLLFPTKESEQAKKHGDASIPTFSNYILGEILKKSKVMYWPISKEFLMSCISVKGKLIRRETNFFRYADEYSADALKLFDGSLHILEALNVLVKLEHREDISSFKMIVKSADVLEDLKLTVDISQEFRRLHMTDSDGYSNEVMAEIGTCKLPKVRRLVLNMNTFEHFPYTLDSDKLSVFEFSDGYVTKTFLGALVGFKQLVRLSLFNSCTSKCSLEDVIDTAATLKSLNFLNMCISNSTVDEIVMNKIMTDMENLDMVELHLIKFMNPDRLLTPMKKLKVLNYQYSANNNLAARSALTKLAHRIGNFDDLDGLMAIASTTPTWHLYTDAISGIFNNNSVNYGMLIEAEETGIFNFRSPLMLHETSHSIPSGKTPNDLMTRMTCYRVGRNYLYGFPDFEKWIQDFMKHNEHTHMAEKLRKLLSTDY